MSGDDAGKVVRGYYNVGGQGSIEFEADSDYNIYKSGSAAQTFDGAEICLKVYCQGITQPFMVGVGETPDDGDIPVLVSNWQNCIEFPSE